MLVALLAGCAKPPPRLQAVQRALREGRLERACSDAQRALSHARDSILRVAAPPGALAAGAAYRPRGEALASLRLWISCEARRGGLGAVATWLAEQSPAVPSGQGRAPAATVRLTGLLLYGQALVQLAQGPTGLAAAEGLLRRAEQAWPDEQEITYRHGMLLLSDDRSEAALVLLRRACRPQPRAECQVALAHALVDLGRDSEARVAIGALPQLAPRGPALAHARAVIRRLARRGALVPLGAKVRYLGYQQKLGADDQAAAELLPQLIELTEEFPEFAGAHRLLGLAHLRLDNAAAALASLRRAAKLNSRDPMAPLLLGALHESRQRLREAALAYQRAIALDPFSARALAALAKIRERGGQHRAAAALYRRLLLLGDRADWRRQAAQAHLRAGLWGEAASDYDQLLRQAPGDFEAHLRLGQLLLRRFTGEADRGLLARARQHAAVAAGLRTADPEVRALVQALRTH